MSPKSLVRPLAAVCLALFVSMPAMAKTQYFVVPFQAGGPSDFTARTIVPEAQKLTSDTIVVENAPGAGGAIAAQRVLQAPADGSMAFVVSPSELISTPLVMATARFKPEDFRPVSLLVSIPMIMVGRPNLPHSSVDELVQANRGSAGRELSYGSVGEGSILHLPGVKFAEQTGVKMLHVTYKGAAPILADLMGGQIDVAFLPMTGNIFPLIRDGKLKALGVAAKQPHPMLPNVPTLGSSRSLDDFNFDVWLGIFVTRQTPEAVVQQMRKQLYQALSVQSVRSAYEKSGSIVMKPMSGDELDKFYAAETARYRALVKSANIQPK